MKFIFEVDFDLPKTVTSASTKPEVACRRHGRHLEIVYDVITVLAGGPNRTKFGSLMQNSTPITAIWPKLQPEQF